MPYKSEKIKLNDTQDRRKKLSEAQRDEIRELYSSGCFSLNNLAQRFCVSKKTILLTVNSESMERVKQYRKEHWKQWQRTGEEWNKVQREHRAYKHELYKAGLLTDENSNFTNS